MEKVAVTGGSGLLGRAVLQELRTHGWRTSNFDAIEDSGLADTFTRGNILDQEAVDRWLPGHDALIHLAAIPAPGIASDDWLTMVNVVGTARVLRAAARQGIRRIVLASSVSALGLAWGRRFMPRYFPIDEAHPLWPEEAYGVSKAVNEIYGMAHARRHDCRVTMLRFPTIVDAANKAAFLSSLARDPEMAARLLWSYVEVGDAARAFRLALSAGGSGGHAYYIVAADHLAGERIETLLVDYYPGVVRTQRFVPTASLISSAAAGIDLGWTAEVAWGSAHTT